MTLPNLKKIEVIESAWKIVQIVKKSQPQNNSNAALKGTVVQIEKVLINDRLRVSRVSCNFCIPTIYNFAVTYP